MKPTKKPSKKMVKTKAPSRKRTSTPNQDGCKQTIVSEEDKEVACNHIGVYDVVKCLNTTSFISFAYTVIPTQIGLLTKLTTYTTSATGTIPTEIGCLTRMERYVLYGDLEGKIPTSIGKLTRLVQLSFPFNNFQIIDTAFCCFSPSDLIKYQHLLANIQQGE
jgi:hypothetical protein